MMGIREAMNANPGATKVVVCLFVAVACTAVGVQLFGGQRRIETKLPDVYFTDDDGKTFFAAGPENVPPFTHEGKVAVQAFVYRSKDKDFVGYLSRFKPETREKIIATKTVTAEQEKFGREVKKPGAATWSPASDLKAAMSIATVLSPDGTDSAEPVEPGS